jgi:hypothetical protein
VEEVVIGTQTRGEEDLLGQVFGIEADGDRIYILDRVFHMVRVFDLDGNHVANIGRKGEGPGEFSGPTGMALDPSRSELVVRESGLGVTHRFTLDGEFVNRSPANVPGWVSWTMLNLRVTDQGKVMMVSWSLRFAETDDRPPGRINVLYSLDEGGALADSLDLPGSSSDSFILKAYDRDRTGYRSEPVPFWPRQVWTIGFDGSLITGTADEYRFEIDSPEGRHTVIERETERIEVVAEERDAAERRVLALMRDVDPGWRWRGPQIPDVKPWFTALIPDHSGRIWVLREGEGRRVDNWVEPDEWREWRDNREWVSERWFDVFEKATGRFLGRVNAPDGLILEPEPFIADNTFICLTDDPLGRPIVRRYRLDLPS